jgi:hypothetical protein
MATERELIYDIRSIIAPKITDDDNLSELQIRFWIKSSRAVLIRRDYEKGRAINPDIIQSLGCVEVVQVDSSECGLSTGCVVLRTKCQIPNTIEGSFTNMITRVGPASTMLKSYPIKPYSRLPWLNKDKFTKNITKAALHNGYIYLVSSKQLEGIINIQGVFENPEEVSNFTTCEGEACYSLDNKYPLGAHLIDALKQMVVELAMSRYNIPNDEVHDNSDNKPSDLKIQ